MGKTPWISSTRSRDQTRTIPGSSSRPSQHRGYWRQWHDPLSLLLLRHHELLPPVPRLLWMCHECWYLLYGSWAIWMQDIEEPCFVLPMHKSRGRLPSDSRLCYGQRSDLLFRHSMFASLLGTDPLFADHVFLDLLLQVRYDVRLLWEDRKTSSVTSIDRSLLKTVLRANYSCKWRCLLTVDMDVSRLHCKEQEWRSNSDQNMLLDVRRCEYLQ